MKYGILGITLLSSLFATTAKAELWPIYGIGIGAGNSSLEGDFIKTDSGLAHQFGFDWHTETFIGQVIATNGHDNEYRDYRIAVGGGWKHFKMGLGYFSAEGTIPTEDNVSNNVTSLGNLISADTTKDTEASVTSASVFMNIIPYQSNDFMFTLDSYYGFYSKGSLTVPVKVLGLEGYMHTQSRDAGLAKGYGMAALWRLGSIDNNLGLKLSYTHHEHVMEKTDAYFQDDVFNSFGTISLPNLRIEQNIFMLSVMMVTE